MYYKNNTFVPMHKTIHDDDEHNIPSKPPVLRRQHATYGADHKKSKQVCEHCNQCMHRPDLDRIEGASHSTLSLDSGAVFAPPAPMPAPMPAPGPASVPVSMLVGDDGGGLTGGKERSSRGPRRVPEHHPSAHKVGTRKRGLDGRMYEVKLNAINVQRWMPCPKK